MESHPITHRFLFAREVAFTSQHLANISSLRGHSYFYHGECLNNCATRYHFIAIGSALDLPTKRLRLRRLSSIENCLGHV